MANELNSPDPEPLISIALPERHWVIILALLQHIIDEKSVPQIKELTSQGAKLEDLNDTQVSTLMGPFFARGRIVKELVARGVMKEEANEEMGIEKLLAIAQRFKDRQGQ